MYNILLIGLKKYELLQFDFLLSKDCFLLIDCPNYQKVIGLLETKNIHLVIFNANISGDNAFEIRDRLESISKNTEVPVFVIINQGQVNLIKIALECGVHNLIFKPFFFPEIEKKIHDQLLNRKLWGFLESHSFTGFFENNYVPMMIIKENRITRVNRSFSVLINNDFKDCKELKLPELFQFENETINYQQYKKLDLGLIPYCNLKNLKLIGLDKVCFDLFLFMDTTGSIIAQANTLKTPTISTFEKEIWK